MRTQSCYRTTDRNGIYWFLSPAITTAQRTYYCETLTSSMRDLHVPHPDTLAQMPHHYEDNDIISLSQMKWWPEKTSRVPKEKRVLEWYSMFPGHHRYSSWDSQKMSPDHSNRNSKKDHSLSEFNPACYYTLDFSKLHFNIILPFKFHRSQLLYSSCPSLESVFTKLLSLYIWKSYHVSIWQYKLKQFKIILLDGSCVSTSVSQWYFLQVS